MTRGSPYLMAHVPFKRAMVVIGYFLTIIDVKLWREVLATETEVG